MAGKEDKENFVIIQPSHINIENPENVYENYPTAMGNSQDKRDHVDVPNKQNVTKEAVFKDSDLIARNVERDTNNRKRAGSPGVKLLASQFENVQTQSASKLKMPSLAAIGIPTQIPSSTEPFEYALAKDIPERVPGRDGSPSQSTFYVGLPSQADSSSKYGVAASAAPTQNSTNLPSHEISNRNIPSPTVDYNDELRLKLERRHQVTLQDEQNEFQDNNFLQDKSTLDPTQSKNSTLESESQLEQTIYDSVCDTLSTSLKDFEVLEKDLASRKSSASSGPSGKPKKTRRLRSEGEEYEWKRKEAKKKSRTLKRSPKQDRPFPCEGKFEHIKDGEAETDDGGIMDALNPFSLLDEDSGSNISDFTDSSFESSDSEKSDIESGLRESYSTKPLPPEPGKNKIHNIRDIRQLMYRGDADQGDKVALEKVNLRRKRESPKLPEAPAGLNTNQLKLRGVLQSLIDSEMNYITSLDRLVKEYRDPIQLQFGIKKHEVVVTFEKVEEIQQIHQMYQIELGDKLAKWTTDERIGNTFHLFSGNMVLDIYSDYVNNYEAASEMIKEASNTRQNFKNFLKEKQMSSSDRLSISGLMLKPIQRFPQFIMIIKDLLKYTPREHHDRVPLQEALTGMENVAHQLNERKRQSEQYFHGQQIMAKLAPRMHSEKKMFLIRQDDVEQLSQDHTGQQTKKQRRIFLMNDKLISIHVESREQNGMAERFRYKWHQSLHELELTTSAITPNMLTKVHKDNTAIISPKIDHTNEDPYSLASDLTDMVHDINLLAQIQMLVSALRLNYPKLNEDLLHETMTSLQKDIQGVDYHLQLINSSSIILHDKVRKKKYVFSAANARVKQEWCIDFLLAKYALDVVNIPSWHKQEFVGVHDKSQPALLMKHLSVDMQRTFTRVKCAVPVYFPMRNEGCVEHLWVCCSTESLTQVSIVSLHTARPALVESFQAAQSEIVCAEMVPGYAYNPQTETAFPEDTVWMSTTDSEILVFMLSERDSTLHRRPTHVFKQASLVLCMLYVDDRVFCGSRSGGLVVYNRNDAGEWSLTRVLQLGTNPVKSIICVNDTVWVACGPSIHIVDAETHEILDKVGHQHSEEAHFNCLVKAGVGVWASFVGKSNISLYHVETKLHLQDYNIGNAVNDFIAVHSGSKDTIRTYEVTTLMATLGLLWVGTDIGILLTYPLPRLRDGVPKINQRPSVALHGHNRMVQFIIPVHYGPISGAPVKRRPSEILKKSKITESVLQRLPKVDEVSRPDSGDSHKYLTLNSDAMMRDFDEDNVYEPVDTSQPVENNESNRESSEYEYMHNVKRDDDINYGSQTGQGIGKTVKLNCEKSGPESGKTVKLKDLATSSQNKQGNSGRDRTVNSEVVNDTVESPKPESEGELRESGEHTYFVLEKVAGRQRSGSSICSTEDGYADMTHSPRTSQRDSNQQTSQNNSVHYCEPVSSPSDKSKSSVVKDLKEKTVVNSNGDCKVDEVNVRKGFQNVDKFDPVVRPKSSPVVDPQPISFRSELKNKVKLRKSWDNLTDRDVTKEEVGRLYATLMRPRNAAQISPQESFSSQSNSNQNNAPESLYVRPNYSSPINPQKPNYSSLMRKPQKLDSVKQKRQAKTNSLIEPRSPSSPTSPVGKNSKTSSSFSTGSSKVTSSFSQGSNIDTLRRQDTNTILVLTGGDGYKDWKKRQNLQSYRPEEPSLVFWLYKF